MAVKLITPWRSEIAIECSDRGNLCPCTTSSITYLEFEKHQRLSLFDKRNLIKRGDLNPQDNNIFITTEKTENH
jgi:hypothetical protein